MFGRITKLKKLEKAKEMFADAYNADNAWQGIALEDFNFRNNEQWTKEEIEILEEEQRPVLTFNLIKSSIDLLIGMSEDSSKVFRASPVEKTDGFLAEVLNDIIEWVYDSNSFEIEQVGALESAAICGRGYLGVDFVPDPKRFGDIKMSLINIPVHEIHFDPSSRRINLDDASYICWDKWLSREDFKIRYPKVTDVKIDHLIEHGINAVADGLSMTGNSPMDDIPSQVVSDSSDYEQPLDLNYYDKVKNMVRVVHMEYWENYKRYFGYNPETDDFEEFDGKDLKRIKEEFEAGFGEKFTYETLMDKKVKWLQFVGDSILYDDDSPLPYPGFSICNMIAYRDPSGRTNNHFGVVRLMKDPQKEVNKRWSQTLNLLNNQVQPGVYAETDAFENQPQAESSLKEPGSVTYVTPGAINGGKFKERTVPAFPNASMQMEQYSQDILKKITGINPDLLGQDRGRQEPGVVVRLRQQQGLTLLKPLFNHYNILKKGVFKRMLAIIMQYMPDKQIMRILGQNDRYQIDKKSGMVIDQQHKLQANIRDIRNLEYNINADSTNGSRTNRMFELTALMEMQEKGFMVDPIVVIEKMDLPESDKVRWIKYIEQQQESQSKQQEQQVQQETAFKDREISTDETKNTIKFVTDMLKIQQMANKDDKKQETDFAKLGVEQKKIVGDFMKTMITTLAQQQNKENSGGSGDGQTKK